MSTKNAQEKKQAQQPPQDDHPEKAGKAKSTGTVAKGEQGELIETLPDNIKEIARIAKAYKRAVQARMAAGDEEVELKQKLLHAVNESNVQYVDGKKTVRFEGLVITVTPRDELITVKDKSEEKAA